ncbi:MAG: 2-oxoglutarate dehydrogenase E1 component [Flavobacteriales bacterium]|nr:2-oxoglutarate dehydrogenase E1 component [Flavobacteriales bacterium]
MDKFSFLGNGDVNAVENMYKQYKKNPESVEDGWARFFEGFDFFQTTYGDAAVSEDTLKEFRVINLINDYRSRGHLFTKTNPVRERRKYLPTLDLEHYDLADSDLDTVFNAGVEIGIGPAPLKDIVSHLKATYCGSIGSEFMYIRKVEEVNWLKEKIDPNQPNISKENKLKILRKLNEAVGFESFLHKKFIGQKRFSLEGGEALIPALDVVSNYGSELGVEEIVIGMAHRGRLNVLANVLKKTYADLFSEFEGKEYEDNLFDGDVKYHLGYSSEFLAETGKKLQLTLAPNPSHLEAVDPVVEGIVRAKIDTYLKDESKIIPILIHGDASIAGQGIVYEVVQMAELDGYRTGGTIHIVVNNQIGFTTNYLDARTSTYCTDVGKVTLSPIFHVNGDDVEAVVRVMEIAVEYRQKFHKDVFIDLLCYRKYGHNEGDEPRFTQPTLYQAIAKHKNPRDIFVDKLISEGALTSEEAKQIEKDFNQFLQERLMEAKEIEIAHISNFLQASWAGLEHSKTNDFDASPDTGVDKAKILEIAGKINTLPEDMPFFKKMVRLMDDRKKMVAEDRIDWAIAELLAYGTLLQEAYPVRVSGQDVERGTFSHRHAVITLEDSKDEYVPLQHLSPMQGEFSIYNSLLSEYGVLGFEYGYAMANPYSLVIWEAQFGDFFNGAQIIVDQFISAAEDKWACMNGLVMLLPHGYEGQGAEHSSARMERFLSQCAEENIQVANCTTPANFFHILRRQVKWPFRKPLIVFTPKSLLRHPKCVSTIDDLASGKFQEVIDDSGLTKKGVKRIVFCSGKLYYDLLQGREERKTKDVAIVRIEQLYPLPQKQIAKLIKSYPEVKDLVWAQEEPENMGAWSYLNRTWTNGTIRFIGRHESGSPASGSMARFKQRQQQIIETAFEKV